MINHHDDHMTDHIAAIGARVLAGEPIDRAGAERLIQTEGDAIYDLFYWANKIRIRHIGPQVKFCSILAAKVGACSEDCSYCSQSAHFKTGVAPTRHDVASMATARDQAAANGASSFGIVNSGRGPTDRELDWMEPFFRETAEQGNIRPCATLGELSESQAQRLRDMGVLRVNHNLETSRRFFPNIISTHSYDDRVRTIRIAKQAGLSICSGGIFGMGESWADRLDVAFELRDLGADVVPINFLVAIQGTPLYGKVEPLSPMQALKIIAIYRFILPDRELKIAGGREKVLRDMQSWIFFAGGSSFLIGNYLTTFGRGAEDDHQMLRDLDVPFVTFDEVEHAAPPRAAATGPQGQPGSVMALPVMH
jgi:biotin synthase